MSLGLALLLGLGGCQEASPPTLTLKGNRGAIKPGGVRVLKTGEAKTQAPAEKH
jgi:hypothetical protein